MSSILLAESYRNPVECYVIREACTCKGCIWERRIISMLTGEVTNACGKMRPYGKRCNHYQERG